MSTQNTPERPAVMDDLSETQLQELEFQASEHDQKEFEKIAATYGWEEAMVKSVWAWFEVQNNYPIDPAVDK